MTSARRRLNAIEDFCSNANAGDEGLPEFFRLLRAYVDSDHAAYFHADTRGRICGAYHEVSQHDAQASEFIRRARAGTDSRRAVDPPSVAQMFRMEVPLQNLSFESSAARESALYRDVIGPIGGRHILRLGLRVGNRPAGLMALVRGRTARGFTSVDTERGLSAARQLRRLVTRPVTDGGRVLTSEGFLTVSRDGTVMNGNAEGWRLWQLVQDRRFLPPVDGGELLGALLEVTPHGECRRTVRTGWGAFVLVVEPLRTAAVEAGAATFLLRVQRWVFARILYLRRMNDIALSSTQKLVCLELLRGASQSEIAAELGIGVHTAISHIRAVYAKAGVSDRTELASVFGSPKPDVNLPLAAE